MDKEIVERVLKGDEPPHEETADHEINATTIAATVVIGVLTLVMTGNVHMTADGTIMTLGVLVGSFVFGAIVAAAWSRVRARIGV